MLFLPLAEAIYGQDFRRGTMLPDGVAFFVGRDASLPQLFSLVGEIKDIVGNAAGFCLKLGRPSNCAAFGISQLFWRQQVSVLERVMLVDVSIDRGLRVVGICIRRFSCGLNLSRLFLSLILKSSHGWNEGMVETIVWLSIAIPPTRCVSRSCRVSGVDFLNFCNRAYLWSMIICSLLALRL